jgi:hypothetical protein
MAELQSNATYARKERRKKVGREGKGRLVTVRWMRLVDVQGREFRGGGGIKEKRESRKGGSEAEGKVEKLSQVEEVDGEEGKGKKGRRSNDEMGRVVHVKSSQGSEATTGGQAYDRER